MPGYPVTAVDVNNRAGSCAMQLRDALQMCADFKAWLDSQPDANLVALGVVAGDVTTIKSALSDLKQLSDIYTGAANLSVAKDFRAFAKLLTGVV